MSRHSISLTLGSIIAAVSFTGVALADDARQERMDSSAYSLGVVGSAGTAHKIIGTGGDQHKIIGTGGDRN
jgi:hypothetical protein